MSLNAEKNETVGEDDIGSQRYLETHEGNMITGRKEGLE